MAKRAALLCVLVGALGGARATAWDLGWIDLIGLPGTETATAPAVDSSGVYVLGTVVGALPGQTAFGSRDIWLRKYSHAGLPLWTRQLGTPLYDYGISIQTYGGSVYVGGRTFGSMTGQPVPGAGDVFVQKYSGGGDLLWTTQLGTASFEGMHGVVVNATGVYLAGETYGTFPGQPEGEGADNYVARLALDGTLDWVRQLGNRAPAEPPLTTPGGVAVDETGVYLVANVVGSMAFRKFDLAGNPVWIRDVPDVESCYLYGFAVSAHGGRVSFIGQVNKVFFQDMTRCEEGDEHVGALMTFDADGNLLWVRAVEAGPVAAESPFTGGKVIHATASGLYVAANTTTTFSGYVPPVPRPDYSQCSGLGDLFFDALDGYVRRYDWDGNVIWTRQFGGGVFDIVTGLATGDGAVYAAGDTSCTLEGQPYAGGSRDGFVVRLTIDPGEPQGLTHLLIGRLDTLHDGGILKPAVRADLLAPVGQALRALEAGAVETARDRLRTFVRAVRGYERSGVLTSAEAGELVEAAQAVLAAL